jgi:hypothetical protein
MEGEIMRIDNVHERTVIGGPAEVGPLLARLGQPDDPLYPPSWPPMRYPDGIVVGSRGTHGVVSAYEPGRLLELRFPDGMGITGAHAFTVTPLGDGTSRVRHAVDADATPVMWLAWKIVIEPAHDAVLEELLDRLATAIGTPPVRPAAPSPYARVLRWIVRPRARATDVRLDGLAAGALPRIDHADAFAVERRRETPADPHAWADAIFHSPPAWVVVLMGLREALVGLVGIERGGPDAFTVHARNGDEVLLGSDAGHLDFRAVVRTEPDQVVLTTVVQLNNLRGHAYFGLVRLVHPLVVRSMLRRAALRMARKSNARGAAAATIEV